MGRLSKTDIIPVLVITASWIAMSMLVNPFGDFPLNDDWAYGYSVKILLEKGDLQFLGWTATNLVAQVVWGALFCVPFGFSFTALRLSTLALGLIGVFGTYGLLREVVPDRNVPLFGAMIVATNPIYFGLSNTFMNDVPFFAFAVASFYFLLRGLKRDSNIELAIGILIAFITILTRQLGLTILPAFGCAYVLKKKAGIGSFVKGFSPAFFGLGIQFSYQKWLQHTMRLPDKYGNQVKTLIEEVSKGVNHLFHNFTSVGFSAAIYLGFFLFPFLIVSFGRQMKGLSNADRKRTAAVVFFLSIAIMMVLALKHKRMPLAGNILFDFGIGPAILKNGDLPNAPRMLWIFVTAAGATGAAILAQNLFSVLLLSAKNHKGFEAAGWRGTFILVAISIYFLPLGLLGFGPFGFYDRYIILLLPLLMTVSASMMAGTGTDAGSRSLSAAFILVLYSLFSIGATHDYLSWNRARWQALGDLMSEKGIPPRRIDGGFEFNGWYLYDPKYDDWKYDPQKSWYWVDKDDYIVSFKPVAGYDELKRYEFNRWLTWDHGHMLVLEKRCR